MEDEDENNDILGLGTSPDDGSGALSMGAATSAPGLAALDMPEARDALATMARSSAAARAALSGAREKIAARKYNRSLPWFALSSALSKPTRTGGIGEVFGNVSDALQGSARERDTFQQQRDKELLGLDTQIAGLDSSTASAQLKLAELKAKLGVQQQLVPNDKVIGPDGKVRYRSRPQARGEEAWTPPGNKLDVSVNTEKSLYGTMADKLGEQYTSQYMTALKAPQAIQHTRELRELLKTKPYTGAGANFKLLFGKAAKAAGYDYAGDDIKNTEVLASRLGQDTLDSVKSSGLAGSQGLTEGERKFLLQIVGGTITLDNASLSRLAELHERTARDSVKAWNDTYSRLDRKQLDQLGARTVRVDDPNSAPAAALDESAPPAASPATAPRAASGNRGLAPAQWAIDPGNPPPRAPEWAEKDLKAHPEHAKDFLDHYGYLLPEL